MFFDCISTALIFRTLFFFPNIHLRQDGSEIKLTCQRIKWKERDFSVSSKALAASPRLQKLKLSGCHRAVKEKKKKSFHSCIKLHNKKKSRKKSVRERRTVCGHLFVVRVDTFCKAHHQISLSPFWGQMNNEGTPTHSNTHTTRTHTPNPYIQSLKRAFPCLAQPSRHHSRFVLVTSQQSHFRPQPDE